MSKETPEDLAFLIFSKGNSTLGDFLTLMRFNEPFYDGRQKLIVELGTDNGLGAMVLASKGARVTTIDNHRDKHLMIWQYLLEPLGINAVLNHTADAAMLCGNESVDVLYVDGDHTYEGVKRDYEAWFPKMKVGGVIIFHDMDPGHEGVWEFFNRDIQDELESGRLREIDCTETQRGHHSVIKVFVREK